MAYKAKRGTKGSVIAIFGMLFLVLSLGVGLLLVKSPVNIVEKAAYPVCPGGEQCPVSGYPDHLRSCHPGEVDGSPSESLCNLKGRVETCGPNYTKYCCPAVGGAWTTNMSACATPTPTPTRPPTPTPTPVKTPTPVPTPVPTPSKTPSPTPVNNPWDVNQDGKIDIIDIGLIVDNYGKSPQLDPRTDVNHDGSVDIVDIGIVIDHYQF